MKKRFIGLVLIVLIILSSGIVVHAGDPGGPIDPYEPFIYLRAEITPPFEIECEPLNYKPLSYNQSVRRLPRW